MKNNIPDNRAVDKIINNRLREYLSVVLGNVDISDGMMERIKLNNENINTWMDLFINNFKEIKNKVGIKNNHILAYVIIIQSWINYTCTEEEEIFAIRAIYEFLSMTNINGELNTPETYGLESMICHILEQLDNKI